MAVPYMRDSHLDYQQEATPKYKEAQGRALHYERAVRDPLTDTIYTTRCSLAVRPLIMAVSACSEVPMGHRALAVRPSLTAGEVTIGHRKTTSTASGQ